MKNMIQSILEASVSDQQLSAILTEVREYTQVYMLARQRQKGCDGMGELAMVKEEFVDVVDKMIQYCREREYVDKNVSYEIDSLADDMNRL